MPSIEVCLYDSSAKTTKSLSHIELEEGAIAEKAALGDIRQTLLDKNAFDDELHAYSFCTPDGVEVEDTLEYSEYKARLSTTEGNDPSAAPKVYFANPIESFTYFYLRDAKSTEANPEYLWWNYKGIVGKESNVWENQNGAWRDIWDDIEKQEKGDTDNFLKSAEEHLDRMDAAHNIFKKGANANVSREGRGIFKSHLLGDGPRISIVPRPPEGKVEQNDRKWALTPFQVTVKNLPNDRQLRYNTPYVFTIKNAPNSVHPVAKATLCASARDARVWPKSFLFLPNPSGHADSLPNFISDRFQLRNPAEPDSKDPVSEGDKVYLSIVLEKDKTSSDVKRMQLSKENAPGQHLGTDWYKKIEKPIELIIHYTTANG